MQITLRPTSQLVTMKGVPGRIWEGETDSGVPLQALITQVAVHKNHDNSAFERELTEASAPEPSVYVFPLRMIL